MLAATADGKRLRGSDALAILPFQVDERTWAVGVYVLGLDITRVAAQGTLWLEVDRKLVSKPVALLRPAAEWRAEAVVVKAEAGRTVIRMPVSEDLTWVRLVAE